MSEIKNCPFCGSDDVFVSHAPLAGTLVFVCNTCGADVMFYGAEHSKEKAIKKWNTRAERKAEA